MRKIEKKALTIKTANLSPNVAVVVVLLEIKNRIPRWAVASVVEFENSPILVCLEFGDEKNLLTIRQLEWGSHVTCKISSF